MRLLVTGANGQLGTELRRCIAGSGDFQATFVDIDELDLTDAEAVERFLEEDAPEAVVNAAAYTAVDRAEDEPGAAEAVNGEAVRHLARTCTEQGIRLVHISTDFVFDGSKNRPYTEEDTVAPLGTYGRTKRLGEEAVLGSTHDGVVIRTSWLYSAHGSNFVKTMLRLGRERDELAVIYDQVGSPTWAGDLAVGILRMLPRLENRKPLIYHYADAGVASWYDLAMAALETAGIRVTVHPIRTEQYPTPAQRPAYSVLDTARFRKDFETSIPHWRRSLVRCIEEMESSS